MKQHPTPSGLWFPLEKYPALPRDDTNPKSLAHCPAFREFRNCHYMIRAPFDLHMNLVRENQGLRIAFNQQGTELNPAQLNKDGILTINGPDTWINPGRPLVQLALPYMFFSDDENVSLNWYPSFFSYGQIPGALVCGHYGISDWVRPTSFAFEWFDISKPLILKRGDPIASVSFSGPYDTFKVVECEHTEEVEQALQSTSNITAYMRKPYRVKQHLNRNRPKLLKPLQ